METMAADGGRTPTALKTAGDVSVAQPLTERLARHPDRFDFFQAVRVLETWLEAEVSVGEGVMPDREAVRFRSQVGFGFPANEIETLRPPRRSDEPVEMRVNFMGLAGFQGPLPDWVTELIVDRAAYKDTVLRDFLDLFNHRLVSLMYRAKRKYRPALEDRSPEATRPARSLFSLVGLGTPGLKDRMGVSDRALLPYAGLLTANQRSQIGLERLLSDYFRVPVRARPFRDRWLTLDERDVTRLGPTGQNQRLGRGAVLGRRVVDRTAGFDLSLGPLTLRELLDFLPTGRRFRSLGSLTRFYVGEELDFRVRLRLAKEQVPELRLGRAGDTRLGWSARLEDLRGPSRPILAAAGGARLGWTSWLKTRDFEQDDEQLVLDGKRVVTLEKAGTEQQPAREPNLETERALPDGAEAPPVLELSP
jgi:type VI secretion system protein ImpH